MQRILCFVVIFLSYGIASAQALKQRPANGLTSDVSKNAQITVRLVLPPATPLKVVLDREVRVQKAGEPVHAKIAEPVYSFDKLLIPQGSEVVGIISGIEPVPKQRRILAGLNADFSPQRQVHLEFDQLVLPGGRQFPLKTDVFPGSAGVLQFVPAAEQHRESGNLASRKVNEAKRQIQQQWSTLHQQLNQPGKIHRLKGYALGQLPYRPQYMAAGTSFNLDLREPLDFGTEILKAQALVSVGEKPPSGSVVHAFLVTPLSSAKNKKGDAIEAIISQPLVASSRLVLPEGTRLKGTVLQARPARHLNRNGQLRIIFRQIVPPSRPEQKVEASLEGVAVGRNEHLRLDSEGGAQVTTPKSRYLTTGIAVALASSSFSDHDNHAADAGDAGSGAAKGASGFRLVGAVVAALSRSRAVSSGFGVYGAAMSVYSHFLARGRDVVYPKDMSMLIGLGTRDHGPDIPADLPIRSTPQPIGPL